MKIMVKTKTTIDGETYDDYSSVLDMPGSAADFGVFVDNGGLTITALNEVADGGWHWSQVNAACEPVTLK